MENKLLTIREVCELLSISRTSLWIKVKSGQFPKPIKLGDGTRKAFLASEINDWIAERVADRDMVSA